MNRQTGLQAKETVPLRKNRASWLRHTAVRPVAEVEPLPGSITGGLAVDLTSVPVRPQAQATGQTTTRSCPMSPQRCPFGGACHSCPPRVQAKLKIGQPGDKYEQEADRVAEQVMRMPEPSVQRKGCSSCKGKEEDEDKILQAKPAGSAGNAQVDHPLIQNVLSSPGQPLDAATRSFMEPRFGQDFSGVRVHTDGKAAESARAVNARAYTVGRNVVFGRGQYAPGNSEGRRLVAHELTHVVQQKNKKKIYLIQRSASTCTYGEMRQYAYLNQKGFPPPPNLANVKASIGAACSRGNPCSCYSGAKAKGAQDKAAWKNIVAAKGGSDLSKKANFICIDTQQCWFVDKCRPIYQPGQPKPPLQKRKKKLTPVSTLSLNGGTVYFYNDPRRGNCLPAAKKKTIRNSVSQDDADKISQPESGLQFEMPNLSRPSLLGYEYKLKPSSEQKTQLTPAFGAQMRLFLGQWRTAVTPLTSKIFLPPPPDPTFVSADNRSLYRPYNKRSVPLAGRGRDSTIINQIYRDRWQLVSGLPNLRKLAPPLIKDLIPMTWRHDLANGLAEFTVDLSLKGEYPTPIEIADKLLVQFLGTRDAEPLYVNPPFKPFYWEF